jgi:hypothetical protein
MRVQAGKWTMAAWVVKRLSFRPPAARFAAHVDILLFCRHDGTVMSI